MNTMEKQTLLKNYVFVFDFDHTLSNIHTRGFADPTTNYITGVQLAIVTTALNDIKNANANNKIIILTRSIKKKLEDNSQIKGIISSGLCDEIIGPDEVEYNESSAEIHWAIWKKNKLEDLQKKYPTDSYHF